MIGYYIHHHGLGHLSRATSICAQLHLPVTALTSLNVPDPHPFAAVLKLPRDDEGTLVADPTAYGAFHWAPHHDAGLMDRMRLIDDIGVDNVMWSSDYPHNESTFGYSEKSLATVVEAVGPDNAVKIVSTNVQKFLGLQ